MSHAACNIARRAPANITIMKTVNITNNIAKNVTKKNIYIADMLSNQTSNVI